MRKISKIFVLSLVGLLVFVGCSSPETNQESTNEGEVQAQENEEKTEDKGSVNLYTSRHYDTDEKLYDVFEEKTGIEVNVIKGDENELMERMDREGKDTSADLFITADAGRLYRAKDRGLLQSIESDVVNENIPSNLRDKDNNWVGLTVRGRVLVYSKDRVDPSELGSYMDLTKEKWDDSILVRSSANIYNQSLLASLIEVHGYDKAKKWASGVVENMARKPEGNDRAQATAVVSGQGDIAIMNTYYLGKMINSSNEEEVKVAKNVAIHFPEKTHINVSGVGLAKHSKNKENAIKFIEFLTSSEAQGTFANANYEYPANPDIEASDLLKSWGEFETQNIDLTVLGENNEKAVKIFNEVGWE